MANVNVSSLVIIPPQSGIPAVDENGILTPAWRSFFHQIVAPKVNYINSTYINTITTTPSTSGLNISQSSGTNSYNINIGLTSSLENIATTPNAPGALTNNGTGSLSYTPIPQGTITSLSVVSANGFVGTVANSTTTPAITLSTSVSGIIKGSGGSLVPAISGTDYLGPISFTQGSIVYIDATTSFAQDNANLFYNPTGYSSMPTVQFGPRGANPIDAGFQFYVSSGVTTHFHNVSTVQSFTGGVTVMLGYIPTGAAVTTGNRVGSLEFGGSYNTSDVVGSCAAIRSYSQDNFTSTTLGGNLVFQTVPSGSATLTTALTLGANQVATFAAPVIVPVYAVGSLPAGTQGMKALVNNALAPTFGAAVVGGGAVVIPVFYNGSAWIVG